jgi:hypothetical protein
MSSGGKLSDEECSRLLDAYVPALRYDSQSAFLAVAASTATDNPTNHLARRSKVLAAASGVPVLSLKTLSPLAARPGADPRGTEDLTAAVPQPPYGVTAPKGRDRIHFGSDHVQDARRMQAEDHYRDRVYGRVKECEDSVHLQYWLWFYSAATKRDEALPAAYYPAAEVADGGAWRLVQVDLDRELEPQRLVLQGATVSARVWANVEKVAGRPRLYVAPLTQMMLFAAGGAWREIAWDGSDGAGRWVTPSLDEFGAWVHWPGRWGTNPRAPRSPALWPAWDQPDRIVPGRFRRAGRHLGYTLFFPLGRRSKSLPEPALNARLELGEVAVGYEFESDTAAALLVTVHPAGQKEVVGRALEHQLEASGQVQLVVPHDLKGCDVRVSALDDQGRRRSFVLVDTAANEPDELERAVLEDVVEEQLRAADMQRYGRRYRVSAQALATSVLGAGAEIWEPAATDLQAFRDARTAHLREQKARKATATLRRSAAIGAPLLVAALLLAVFARESRSALLESLAALAGVIGAVLLIGAAVSFPEWRSARDALRLLRARPAADDEVPLAGARRRFGRAVAEKVVAPRMRAVINRKTTDRYDEALDFGARGLSELRVPMSEIRTDATERLEELTRRMRGGSIGIAGPRGVGKSTLIRSYCQPRTPGDRRLTSELSAPVRYDARDFILTLFAQLCQSVLAGERGRPGPADPDFRIPTPTIVVFAGLVAIMAAAAVIGAGSTLQRAPLAGIAVTAAAVSVGALVGVRWRRYVVGALAVGVAAAGLLAFLEIGGLAGRIVFGLVAFLALAVALWVIPSARRRPTPAAHATAEDRLRALAEQWREEIRFQQSWSEGYSGKFSIPLGAEAGIDRQKTFERRQSTFPELVDELRGFLAAAVAARGEVAVGIDEMDKMESAETAEQFLNEIKAIFGVEGCFYLVSISENAMSSFERRGVPFRDVFDSSFDEVLALSPLPLGDSKRLLRGRVLGLAPPFLDLAHCLSGGLGRDLLRVTRRLSLYDGDDRGIDAVAKAMVKEELERQASAAVISARSVGLEPHVSELQLWLAELREGPPEGEALRAAAASVPGVWPPERRDDPADAARADELESLRLQLSAFAYFLGTVVDFFAEVEDARAHFGAAEVGEDKGESDIDRLARARVAFAVNPQLAVSIVTEFRRARGWEECETLGWTAPAAAAPAGVDGQLF